MTGRQWSLEMPLARISISGGNINKVLGCFQIPGKFQVWGPTGTKCDVVHQGRQGVIDFRWSKGAEGAELCGLSPWKSKYRVIVILTKKKVIIVFYKLCDLILLSMRFCYLSLNGRIIKSYDSCWRCQILQGCTFYQRSLIQVSNFVWQARMTIANVTAEENYKDHYIIVTNRWYLLPS